MNSASLSLHDETHNVLAQRALKLVLVLGLHAAVAGLITQMPAVSAAKYIPAHLEAKTMEVSFIQMQPPAKALQAVQPMMPRAEPAKPLQKPVRHVAPKSEPAQPRRIVAAAPAPAPLPPPTTETAATSATASPTLPKSETPQATAAPQSMPLIAAHVDASYAQKTPPTYPIMSRRLHEEGKVQLLVDVSAKGDVQSILVKKSSGFPRLDDVALNTVRSWHFVPARRGDIAVADSVVVPILFKLND
jgi:protein TonB